MILRARVRELPSGRASLRVSPLFQGSGSRPQGDRLAGGKSEALKASPSPGLVDVLVSHFVYPIPCISKTGRGVDQELQLPQ